jgi:hypothetical protein
MLHIVGTACLTDIEIAEMVQQVIHSGHSWIDFRLKIMQQVIH